MWHIFEQISRDRWSPLAGTHFIAHLYNPYLFVCSFIYTERAYVWWNLYQNHRFSIPLNFQSLSFCKQGEDGRPALSREILLAIWETCFASNSCLRGDCTANTGTLQYITMHLKSMAPWHWPFSLVKYYSHFFWLCDNTPGLCFVQ